MDATDKHQAWFLKSNGPVLFPAHPAFTLPQDEFESFLQTDLRRRHDTALAASSESPSPPAKDNADTDTFTIVSSRPPSTTADIRDAIGKMDVDPSETGTAIETGTTPASVQSADNDHPFMKGLLAHGQEQQQPQPPDMENKMLTENADVAYHSTGEALVDLFSELEEVVSGPRLLQLLEAAWRDGPLVTLKIIFNARSIHLGKSSRSTFYRCAGWLAQNHPLTLVSNLRWLSRPVIEKKVEKEAEHGGEDEMVLVDWEKDVNVDSDVDENDPARFDVRNGVAHGYWKDLLNILVLSVKGKLDALANPRDALNTEKMKRTRGKEGHPMYEKDAKLARYETRDHRHKAAVRAFNEDAVYRALHLSVARLFAKQLKADLAALRDGDARAKKKISLCAKWAPSHKLFHDKHTFIVSAIAEILHPRGEFVDIISSDDNDNKDERELYLRHAREAYRKEVAALRKHLEVVERDLTAGTLEKIKYERVSSLAMRNYAPIFAEKDTERFDKYIDRVAAGKAQISGATLMPSKLIMTVRKATGHGYGSSLRARGGGKGRKRSSSADEMVARKMEEINAKVVDGQWHALVQRIKDSGTLSGSIAICDVSGSMCGPIFPDGTCPMDSAIGLSLVLAEVTVPPFGGAFITFSGNPTMQQVDLTKTLQEKYWQLSRADWSMNTDFVAVFERLILPMAVENKLKQEDMVKRVFVFSDMQFDAAETGCYGSYNSRSRSDGSAKTRWSTSYGRIQEKFKKAGYEMPQLVFWNLAGGRAGYYGNINSSVFGGDPTAPKPVRADEVGAAIVSGYSQGMLKVFLENGSFGKSQEEEVIETVESEQQAAGEDSEIVVQKRKKLKMDPLSTVKKAVGHKAYSMLRVLD